MRSFLLMKSEHSLAHLSTNLLSVLHWLLFHTVRRAYTNFECRTWARIGHIWPWYVWKACAWSQCLRRRFPSKSAYKIKRLIMDITELWESWWAIHWSAYSSRLWPEFDSSWVCCWFSPLLQTVFYFRFFCSLDFLPPQKPTFRNSDTVYHYIFM
jgi:hypothetical protein